MNFFGKKALLHSGEACVGDLIRVEENLLGQFSTDVKIRKNVDVISSRAVL